MRRLWVLLAAAALAGLCALPATASTPRVVLIEDFTATW
jgi:hypothetical protein